MNTKPNILIFVDWFYPGYLAGGPVQSVLSLVNYLKEDFNFKILTTNRDLSSETPYSNITSDAWIKSDLGCEIFYSSEKNWSYIALKKIIDNTNFDLAYINSFFSNFFSIVPLQILNKHYPNKAVILAPRGMLGSGALAIKKWKKKAFLVYSKITGLHKRVIWHATSEQEENEIKNVINPKTEIVRISNLPKKFKVEIQKTKSSQKLNLFFMSRISEKKNLLFALEILKQITNSEIHFSIYGYLEDKNYWERCESIIKESPKNIQIIYKGSVSPTEIETVLANEHVLFLPTLNENFGHSIVESLLCGCPVIISDQTPWNDLEKHDAGFAIPLNNPKKFTEAISKYAQMNQEEFLQVSKAANKYISDKIDLKKVKDQYTQLFHDGIKN